MPGNTPVTIPVLNPIVAMVVALLVHVPPTVALFSVVVWPTQTLVVPVITDGNGFIVIIFVAEQPAGNV